MNSLKKNRERGNVLFLILIAVVLFAGLGFAVSNILQSGNPTTIAGEQARVYAGEILDYGRSMRQAVQNIRISNGCRDTEISFENPVESGYVNGTNTECQIFDSDGGGMNWVSPASTFNDGSEWIFLGRAEFDSVGNTGTEELSILLPSLNINICRAINRQLFGSETIPTIAGAVTTKFTGTYGPLWTQVVSCTGLATSNCMAVCVNDTVSDEFDFYQVLLAR